MIISASAVTVHAQRGVLTGVVTDAITKEPVLGATVIIEGTTNGSPSGLDGDFTIRKVPEGDVVLRVSCVGYKTKTLTVPMGPDENKKIDIDIEEDVETLEGIVIVGVRENNNDISLLNTIRSSLQVVSGVSAEFISKTFDSDAGEVVKRIPGVTIMGDRFIVVRGLNERYNNVLLHNAIAPSMEADVRSFSFDIIPSNMLDQVLIYKSPSADLPGDFSGGLVKIYTKGVPEENSTILDIGFSYRTGTTFKDFFGTQRSGSHFTGFNNGDYNLPSNVPDPIPNQANSTIDFYGQQFANNWVPSQNTAFLDHKMGITQNFRFNVGKVNIGNITSVNYDRGFAALDVKNQFFQIYDFVSDRQDLRFTFNDKIFEENIHAGIVHNWAARFSPEHIIEFKNLFNQITNHDYTDRFGTLVNQGNQVVNNHSFLSEYRGIYAGQLVGTHKVNKSATEIEWTVGYGTSYRNTPDYRRYRYNIVNFNPDRPEEIDRRIFIPVAQSPDFFGKFFADLEESNITASLNLEHEFNKEKTTFFKPKVKAGFFYDNKERTFSARNLGFIRGNAQTFNEDLFQIPIDQLFVPQNINHVSGILLRENVQPSNRYTASNRLMAFYAKVNLPLSEKLSIGGGIRYEDNIQILNSTDNIENAIKDLLPSANVTYSINNKMVLKGTYGRTLNRPEFREIAPFSFYDFAFDATKVGNISLQNAYVDNFDVRWEYYPGISETISVGLFYKNFNSPIESLFNTSGSEQTVFSFFNVESAYARGIELDMRKSLAGLGNLSMFDNMSVLANLAFIDSEVTIGEEALRFAEARDRALQGQSPYIVNVGMFYDNPERKLQVSLLYNVIGKRIFLVGGGSIPDTYEMPRNVVDLNIQKSIGERYVVKLGVKDLLNQEFLLLQDGNLDGRLDRKNDQILRQFNPGTFLKLGFSARF